MSIERTLEAAIPGLKFSVPFTLGAPIQAFGMLGDERFEFAWKRHTAWLAVGEPAERQPFATDPEALTDLLVHVVGLAADQAEARARGVITGDATDGHEWIVVEPRRYAQASTDADEDFDELAEVFTVLHEALQPVAGP